ncbi:GtrA-like protein [Clostridium cavendishii DSM 21758]|uniref:GtrA-like protein n=1 Tax=Clostridium cavendishii DSM 21758 TaxID=1121302 RepID=A0A1M6JAP2_9CLOT|nr:GtrA family protein [Clostridium cavendishii]SHJ43733.1 GtrA-like protein [Clostridium cavendishii DSM 21758]
MLKNKNGLIVYFLLSCGSSVIDIIIGYVLFNILNVNYLVACNIGIIAGLIFHYITSIKAVFKKENNIKNFSIYIITFFIGLILANITMWISFDKYNLGFLISKIFSMGIPFFVMYYLRKILYKKFS